MINFIKIQKKDKKNRSILKIQDLYIIYNYYVIDFWIETMNLSYNIFEKIIFISEKIFF